MNALQAIKEDSASVRSAQRLESLESQAHAHYAASLKAWRQYVAIATDIHDSNLWRSKASTWELYCEDYMPTVASTIRTYKSSLPIAQLVETITGEELPESEARKLGGKIRKVCKDVSLIGETYQKVYELTGHALPSDGEIAVVYENLKRRNQEGVISVNGRDVSLLDALDDTIRFELYELKQRQSAHIEASQQIVSKRIEIAQKAALGAIFDYSSAKTSNTLFDFIFAYKERIEEKESE